MATLVAEGAAEELKQGGYQRRAGMDGYAGVRSPRTQPYDALASRRGDRHCQRSRPWTARRELRGLGRRELVQEGDYIVDAIHDLEPP